MSRTIVMGLDGLPAPLLQQFVAAGIMPNLSRLLAEGCLAGMDTVHPPLSSVAWTTFFTGVNPGQHRIFGFFEAQVDAYGLWFQNLSDVKAPTLWEILQGHGRRTLCVNLPGTYPAPPLNGVMVSGFVAEDFGRSIYPKALRPTLERLGYLLDVRSSEAFRRPDAFWQSVQQSLSARAQLFGALLDHEPGDLCIAVVTETDRVQHFFFDAIEEPHHPARERVMQFYHQVDNVLGFWLGKCRHDDEVILMADHGFARVQQDVHINYWLAAHGYLSMQNDSPGSSLSHIDPARTRAFALDPGRIYLNIKGRQPEGIVAQSDAGRLREEIAAGLAEWKIRAPWSPTPVHPIARVFHRDEIYSGPWTSMAPDLIVCGVDGFDLKGGFDSKVPAGPGFLTGMHTFGNAMLYIRGRQWNTAHATLLDIAPTIMRLLGLPIPPHMEGRPLVEN
jgi:predicted AlkP superfamily phosphohydrolase/phosphomutase